MAYVKDNILHIILVDNADTEHYKSILNDDSVGYHYTDVSYTQLFDTRNMLRDIYEKCGIYIAAINDETSQIELTVIDLGVLDDIKSYLKSKGISDSFIDKHVVLIEDKDILSHIPKVHYEIYECITDESLSNEKDSKAAVTVYPGQKVWGTVRNPVTGTARTNVATIGFDALRGITSGFVTAWHFAHDTMKFYLNAVSSTSDNSYIGTGGNGLYSEAFDTAFIEFDSGNGSTLSKSRKIIGTDKSLTHVANSNTITALAGKTLHFYGAKNSSTGTVSSTSVDYEMSYPLATGETATTRVYDTIKVSGTSEDHGDSGGPVTYESGTNVTLVGTISGISTSTYALYTYVNKITNICNGMQITVSG